MRLPILLLILYSSWLFYQPVNAAEIKISEHSECRVNIIGLIEKNDFLKLEALKNHLIVFDGESTIKSVVCLNSFGGNVKAGLEIAKFLLKNGIGTRIQKDAKCFSICAIMFMMGNYQGDEVRGLNRKMHATASLGFHRPYLSLKDARTYTSSAIEKAYDIGVETIYEIIELTNSPVPWGTARMIEPDLLQYIIGTSGNDIFVIDTIEQALRWEIEVIDIPLPHNIKKANLHFLCENALALPHTLTTNLAKTGLMSQDIFKLIKHNPLSIEAVVNGANRQPGSFRYRTESLRNGYSFVICDIIHNQGINYLCGIDEATDTTLGNCDTDDKFVAVNPLYLYHPATNFKALWLREDINSHATDIRKCRVYSSDGTHLDEDICYQSVKLYSTNTGGQSIIHTFTWPSGSKTVIKILIDGFGNTATYNINGNSGKFQTDGNDLECIKNTTNKKTFCLTN